MKRILYVLTCIITLTILSHKVQASSFTLSLDGNTEFSNEITLDLVVSNLTDFNNGFYGLEATLNYENTKIELVSITPGTNFELTYDNTVSNRFVVYTARGVEQNTSIISLKFKNLSLSENEQTTITVTNQIGSDGDNDISGTNTAKTIKLVKPQYQKGDLNKNNKIDLPDIILLLKGYLGVEPISEEDKVIADMDENGKIELKDIIQLLKTYLGVN